MKKLTVFIMILLGLVNTVKALAAENTWISSKEGTILLYEETSGNGKVSGYIINRITKVVEDEGKTTIWYHVYYLDTSLKPYLHLSDIKAWTYNGVFHADATSAMASAGMNLEKIVEVKGSGLKLPENADVGYQMGDIEVSIPGMMEMKQYDMNVTAREQVSTPAGTFDAIRIEAKVDGKALFIKTSGSGVQYYSKGVGLIKSVNYNKKGKEMSTQTLVAIDGGNNPAYQWCLNMFLLDAFTGNIPQYGADAGGSDGRVTAVGVVDLALSVYWATKNYNADTKVDAGDSFAWKDRPGLKSGEFGLRTPTKAEWDELIEKCTWEFTRENGVDGYKVTGKNGNWIFIPVFDSIGNYWTDTQDPEEKSKSYKSVLNPEAYKTVSIPYKDKSFMVRPVCETYRVVKK